MRVHVFGNKPSPAVATFGIGKTVHVGQDEYGEDVVKFVERDFYVDDGLVSLPTVDQAIDLLQRTQQALSSGGNLRLHKIASNNPEVMKAFPAHDYAMDLKDLNFHEDDLPIQRSLGLVWNLQSDSCTFQVSSETKPYTRRGVLSTISSLFDPIGFAAPVVIQRKVLLRELMTETIDWDEPLSLSRQREWDEWRDSLKDLEQLQIRRAYVPVSQLNTAKKEIFIYSDASQKAIAAAAYMRTTDTYGIHHTGLVLGKAKVAPTHGHTIPRLELCGAVLAIEIAETLSHQFDIPLDSIRYFTDRKVVLGYLHNQIRRFYVYVTNRVDRIRKSSNPQQWRYVPTHLNPADLATRAVQANDLPSSAWLLGPSEFPDSEELFSLTEPDKDKEVRPIIISKSTYVMRANHLGTQRFIRFSSWKSLVEAIARLQHIVHTFRAKSQCNGWHSCPESSDSPILALDPTLDENGVLREGGRLKRSNINFEGKHPVILPGRHHIATLLTRHHHETVKHQGRLFTEGAVRSAGLWITGCKRLINSILYKCVQCRKQRRQPSQQKMSDLPVDRLTPAPPFTYVGLDTFGPWSIVSRRTRDGSANSKRWAILFTYMTTRAIHIEVIEEMTSSSFINALRRFQAIRGKVTQYRSDRGTNFIGATDDFNINAINVEDAPVKTFLYNKGVKWIFNPPHSSHMGGAWELMIGITRRILESMLSDVSAKNLTHEVLVTFLSEVCAIVNHRPIVPVSTDSGSPFLLTPNTLLTYKTDLPIEPLDHSNTRDLYRAQWKRVQVLAEQFWKRWRPEYLQSLQERRKWQQDQPNVKQGDIILMKEKDAQRNEWPMGIISDVIPEIDGRVRKAVGRWKGNLLHASHHRDCRSSAQGTRVRNLCAQV